MAPVRPETKKRPQPALSTATGEHLSIFVQEARLRFMEAFEGQCDMLAPPDPSAPPPSLEDMQKRLHRMVGLAGTLGFPRVSARASAMEDALVDQKVSPGYLREHVAALRIAYSEDVANPSMVERKAEPLWSTALVVLLVEDEPLQRQVLSAQLRQAGHEPIEVATGEEVVAAARKRRPDVILLDIELPGIDGYTVCQTLKSDRELAGIPVAFLSAHADVESRMTGLAHGADEFLTKPIDPRELALRVDLLAKRSLRGPTPAALPPATAAKTIPCVLVGDDDEEVVRIVDAHLAAIGYRRILAYDGAQTLAAARDRRPDVIVLDLMMPQLNGFGVLAGLKELGDHRPKVLVLSARGRQEDVIRAFQLGADDFLVKPFNPQELLGRVSRLVRAPERRRSA